MHPSLPMRDCIVRVPSRIFLYLFLTDSGNEPSLRTVLPDPKPQGLLLKLPSFKVPFSSPSESRMS